MVDINMKKQLDITDIQKGAALAIVVVPSQQENHIVSANADGTITVALNEVDFQQSSNQALIVYLSTLLIVPTNKIEIIAGKDQHKKLVSVLNITADEVHKVIFKSIKNAEN